MRPREPYWSYRAPPDPDLRDLPPGTFNGTERNWQALSPGYRRAIWRDALLDQAKQRQLPDCTIELLKIALINGGLGTLDEHLMAFECREARRVPLPEDAARLARADAKHRKSEVQIAAREAV